MLYKNIVYKLHLRSVTHLRCICIKLYVLFIFIIYTYCQSYIITEPPIVSTYHKNYNDTRSVELFGIVSVIDRYPKVNDVYWTKNGEEINTQAERWTYSKWGVKCPSLIIHNVNHQDAGSYRLTATNAVGSDKSDIVLGNCL